MRVLIACECSGIVRDAFIARGHDAMSCDLKPTERPGPHYQGDVREVIDDRWHLMIAHPECRYLSSSGLHWNARGKRVDGRPRSELTEEAIAFVRLLLAAPIPRIALENPTGCISTRVRPYDQMVQPWQFGHDAAKATCLWLKNLPMLRPTGYVEPRLVCCGAVVPPECGERGCANCNGDKRALPRWANQTNSGQNRLGPSPTRSADRARTYQGIADAMAAQWGAA